MKIRFSRPPHRREHRTEQVMRRCRVLCGIVVGLALVAGIAFGGLRLLIKRLFPDSVFDRRETMEFISLHLEEDPRPLPRER